MADLIIHFLAPVVCFILLGLGLSFENYIFGLFAGLGLLSLSVAGFISPIADLSSLTNLIISSLYFGVGAYTFIVGTIEEINKRI